MTDILTEARVLSLCGVLS